ncbi:MAG: hypothetical protein A2Y10_15400 [Planctomycetes bacterium GWF2_41_51]|nr:MAG: hypothetical protein A2Y10_15400 [Planctomycetes bacterium GWF2_41_51]
MPVVPASVYKTALSCPVVLLIMVFFSKVFLIKLTNCSGVKIPFGFESLLGFSIFAIGLCNILPSVSAQFKKVFRQSM